MTDTRLQGGLWHAYQRISRLGIPDPDPTEYDQGYNACVRKALKEIEVVMEEMVRRRQEQRERAKKYIVRAPRK